MKIVKVIILLSWFCFSQNAVALEICTTIKPLNGLVAAIASGSAKPSVIINSQNNSLHHYSLKPSDVVKIKQADVIFIISYDLESFMNKLKNIAKENTEIVELAKLPGIKLLPIREDNIFEADDADEHHHHGDYDNHIWLDTGNAKIMVKKIAEILAVKDPANQKIYHQNYQQVVKLIDDMDKNIAAEMNLINKVPYVVFHDAYQYFENKYKLRSLGAISLNPEKTPGAKTLLDINKLIAQNGAKCIFSEPQFPSAIVEKIAATSKIKTGILDAEWVESPDATEDYFLLMNKIKDNLKKCLY
jgi:zinc transport system substrate-binding protein